MVPTRGGGLISYGLDPAGITLSNLGNTGFPSKFLRTLNLNCSILFSTNLSLWQEIRVPFKSSLPNVNQLEAE